MTQDQTALMCKPVMVGWFSHPLTDILKYFCQKIIIVLDISDKLSPKETICMKSQSLFSGKNKKNIINLSSAEFAQSVVKVKMHTKYHIYPKFLHNICLSNFE